MPMEPIAFALFPSKGLRLRRKISDWLDGFQKVSYVSPYEDYTGLTTDGGDVSEKRVVGLLHELLSLFVEHSAERRKLMCLRKYLELPQRVHKAFERYPHMFYLPLRNKTCAAILVEAQCDRSSAIEAHPLAKVRKKYIDLMKESEVMFKSRRLVNRSVDCDEKKLDLDFVKLRMGGQKSLCEMVLPCIISAIFPYESLQGQEKELSAPFCSWIYRGRGKDIRKKSVTNGQEWDLTGSSYTHIIQVLVEGKRSICGEISWKALPR